MPRGTHIISVLKAHEAAILADWIKEQLSGVTLRPDLLNEATLRDESRAFLNKFRKAMQSGVLDDIKGDSWKGVRDMVTALSRSRALAGFTPSETATFVLSLKPPLFARLRVELKGDAEGFADEFWQCSVVLDKLALLTMEAYQQSREEVIGRQQSDLLDLSTPVVELWEDVLALPLVGTLDSARTQVVMESLLKKIVDTGATIAIIDITGVPTVDTLVAQHLLKTVAATRLMGADCIISGIRPQIAQTIVHLGVDLGTVVTKATLADAFRVALARTGCRVERVKAERPALETAEMH
jgi:rsbT co-antagonist protein RsbR